MSEMKFQYSDFVIFFFFNFLDTVLISLKLTKVSLHNRSLVQLGPTSLRPTIAYNMLRLAKIKAGEVVVDPLCGGGSIPIEVIFICLFPISRINLY